MMRLETSALRFEPEQQESRCDGDERAAFAVESVPPRERRLRGWRRSKRLRQPPRHLRGVLAIPLAKTLVEQPFFPADDGVIFKRKDGDEYGSQPEEPRAE